MVTLSSHVNSTSFLNPSLYIAITSVQSDFYMFSFVLVLRGLHGKVLKIPTVCQQQFNKEGSMYKMSFTRSFGLFDLFCLESLPFLWVTWFYINPVTLQKGLLCCHFKAFLFSVCVKVTAFPRKQEASWPFSFYIYFLTVWSDLFLFLSVHCKVYINDNLFNIKLGK